MKRTWIKNAHFITADDRQPTLLGHMVIEGDLISYLDVKEPDEKQHYDEIIEGKGHVFMPGLINTHNHAAMSFLRGFADDLALKVWLEDYMWPHEAKFTDHDVKWGTLLSIVEMIRGGTTTFVDMYDHMDQVALAVMDSGMRGCLTRGMISFAGADEQRRKLAEAKTFAKTWHGQADGRITAMMSPHSPYTCPPEFIEKIVETAEELKLPIHTHMSETKQEVEQNVQQYGKRPVEHLQSLGVFNRPCLVAHAVHLTDQEIEILRQHDVKVSHNPGSNLKLASGIARVPELLKAGVGVSLGTDSSASNNNLDMFEEMRLAALIHKGNSGDPTAVPAWQAFKMGTTFGAASIWQDQQIGMLKPGMKADFIAIDANQAHLYPKNDYLSHMIYSATSQDVTDVWVNGDRLMKNRELLTVDEEKIKSEFQACYERLLI